MSLTGDTTFVNGTMTELHLRVAPGDITLGGVTLGGDGKCVTSLVKAPAGATFAAPGGGLIRSGAATIGGLSTPRSSPPTTAAPSGAAALPATSLLATGANSGPCVQVDWVANASPPVRIGMRGTLSGSGFTAKAFGLLAGEQAIISGTVEMGAGRNTAALGRLEVTGVMWFASPATARIANASGTLVRPVAGDWRIDGAFSQRKALGPISSEWSLSMGRVSNTVFANLAGDTTLFGSVPVTVRGSVSGGNGDLQYDLRATSAAQTDQRRLQLDPVSDTAIRGVLFAAGIRFDSDRSTHRNDEVRGSVMGVASYSFDVRLSRATGLRVVATGTARVRYAEGFRPKNTSRSFELEPSGDWDTMVSVDLDVNSDTGRACFVTTFANQPIRFGAC
jgi:hypothetical protein